MKFVIPKQYIRYSLMAALCYLIFDKYDIEYNLENCLIALLSFIVINKLLKKTEGFEDESEEKPKEESPDQEESPEIVEEIIEEIVEESEEESEEEESEEPKQEESEEPKQEEIKPYDSEELQKLQKKYTIMPVESWIKNEISLMNDSQKTTSCSCPTLSRGSNDYLEF